MSVFENVENFFLNVGHHVKAAFVKVFGQQTGEKLASAAEEWAKTELGQAAIPIVKGLETAALAPADKQKQAFAQIGSALKAQGQNLPSSLIDFAIEFALQIVRGSVPAA